METFRHFIGENGVYFIAPFSSAEHATNYTPLEGSTELFPPSTEHVWVDGDWVIPPAPDAPPAPALKPYLLAMGQIKTDGTDVVSVAISAALSGAFLFDVGETWCFFLEPQPDENYIVLAYDLNSVRAYVNDEDKFTEYFIIRTTDFSDPPVPTNPLSLNFEVKRVD